MFDHERLTDLPEVFINPFFSRHLILDSPTRAPLEFHKRLPGYELTPLRSLPRLAKKVGVASVWLKDESNRLGLPAFKILGASWAMYRALEQRCGTAVTQWSTIEEFKEALEPYRPITITCATDGNHGRAIARMAKLLGLDARIFMPEGSAVARIQAIESEGATVLVGGTYDEGVANAAKEMDAGAMLIQDTAWEAYETVPRWTVEGYSTLLWETDEALAERGEQAPTLVLVQMGVGSFAHAVVQHYRREGLNERPVIVGVEPDDAACVLASVKAGRIVQLPGEQHSIMSGLNCGTMSSLSLPILRRGINCFLTIPDDRALEATRLLAAEGVVAGETGAAGLGGLIELVESDRAAQFRSRYEIGGSSRVLLISTEGVTDPASYAKIIDQWESHGSPPDG